MHGGHEAAVCPPNSTKPLKDTFILWPAHAIARQQQAGRQAGTSQEVLTTCVTFDLRQQVLQQGRRGTPAEVSTALLQASGGGGDSVGTHR